jgi:UDP-N-acetylglucosamine 2-epimerase (non-hydrolysing)/GDP/UDP-N,N'-diacetylbacillosamine 2-epimerase (hydrolysing)
MRKIAVITGTRAEYGLLYWIIKGMHDDLELELQLIVTGMHLSTEFGMTVNEIEKDGFPIADRVEMLLSSDSEESISTSMGIGMIGFASSYKRLKPDMLIVLGDRFEILSAVCATIPFRIPVAHIHGGESTEGLIDESIRNAVTKMSHIHFTATEKYKKRVIQMGENPDNVFSYGAPGLDNITNLNLPNKDDLLKVLKLDGQEKIGIVTYHPVTLEENTAGKQMSKLLEALKLFKDIFWIFTLPNADTGGREIIEKIKEFTHNNPKHGKDFQSLGQLRYLSLLKYVEVMVGNSSSGLTEAPSFELPVVNIGDRQLGRIRTKNVVDVCECEMGPIVDGIRKATAPEMKKSLQGLKNPYGEGCSSGKIVEKVKSIQLGEALIKKNFYETPS